MVSFTETGETEEGKVSGAGIKSFTLNWLIFRIFVSRSGRDAKQVLDM